MRPAHRLALLGFVLVLFFLVQANAGQHAHRVQAGESLTKIARGYEVSLKQLISENVYLRSVDEPASGQVPVIPRGEKKPESDGGVDAKPQYVIRTVPGKTAKDSDTDGNPGGNNRAYQGLDSSTAALAALFEEFSGTVFRSGSSQSNKIALTFDDGPTEVTCDQVLDILRQYNVRGTFFLLGENISKYPDVVARIAREGHVVAGHSWSHVQLEKASQKRIRYEILGTQNAIYQITGKRPALVRPPYGSINRQGLEYLKNNGYTMVNWSVDSLDWKYPFDPDNVLINTMKDLRGGSIILFHTLPGKERSKIIDSVLPELIRSLQAQGYQFVTVDQLLSIPAYK